jgi:hypothetical protein
MSLSIDSLSSLKAFDVARASRDKPRDLKSQQVQDDKVVEPKASIIRAGDSQAFAKAESFTNQTSGQPNLSLNEKNAINAYQSMAKDQQKQDIQMLLGVDTFV